jgi:hypothetical protein
MERMYRRDCEEGPHSGAMRILPFLAILLVIGLMKGMMHHRIANMSERQREDWKNGVPPMFAEFHRRAHAAEEQSPTSTQA